MEDGVTQPEGPRAPWKAMQAYLLAAVCLMVGLPIGYFLRGSSPQDPAVAAQAAASEAVAPTPAAAQSPAPDGMPHAMPSMDDMKRMADKKAEPLLAKLKADPNNPQLLNQLGILYRMTHQFQKAEDYFQKSLQIDPKNADVRTDLAACIYYRGDVDGALAELNKALTSDPKHAGALMNIGIIRWQGKNDVPGAVASWQKLLTLNPNFPQKEQVQQMIAEAQRSSVLKNGKSATAPQPAPAPTS